jgi:hypothetical protein
VFLNMSVLNGNAEGLPQSQVSARDALEARIVRLIRAGRFSYSELATVGVRIARLSRATPQYGHCDLATDTRDFIYEGACEGEDRTWYQDAKLVFDHDPAFADIRAIRAKERVQERRDRLKCFQLDAEWKRKDDALTSLVDACTIVEASASFDVSGDAVNEYVPPASEVLP